MKFIREVLCVFFSNRLNKSLLCVWIAHPPNMHLYRSKRPIIWLRLCAISYPLFVLSMIAQIVVVVYGSLNSSKEMMMWVIYGMAFTVFMGLFYLFCSCNSKCPLCRIGPMSSQQCVKHGQAGRLFGSYRLQVILGVILLNRFRCPYCGESTLLKVKGK